MSKTITNAQQAQLDAQRAEAKEIIDAVKHEGIEENLEGALAFFDALAAITEVGMLPIHVAESERTVPPVIDNVVLEKQLKSALALMFQHETPDERFARKTEMTAQERVEQIKMAAETYAFALTLINYSIHEVTVMSHRRPRNDAHRAQWEDVTSRIFAGVSYELIATMQTILMIGSQAKAEAEAAGSKQATGVAKRTAAAATKRADAAEKLVKELKAELEKAAEETKTESETTDEEKAPKTRRTRRAASTTKETVEKTPSEEPTEEDAPKTEPVASVTTNDNGPTQTASTGSARRGGRGNRSLRQAARK